MVTFKYASSRSVVVPQQGDKMALEMEVTVCILNFGTISNLLSSERSMTGQTRWSFLGTVNILEK